MQPGRQPWRWIQDVGLEAVERCQPCRGVARDGVKTPAFAEHFAVEAQDSILQSHVPFGMVEITKRRSTEIVNPSILMCEPGDLVGMPHKVRRELRGNDQIDRLAIALAQIQEAPRGRVGQDLTLRIPLERNRKDFRFVSKPANGT